MYVRKVGEPYSSRTQWPEGSHFTLDRAGVPEVPSGELLTVPIVLLDASTGVIQALRMAGWSAQFAESVRDAVSRQRNQPAAPGAGDREIDAWFERYPTAEDLMRGADVTSRG